MRKADIIEKILMVAQLMEIRGDNQFKIRAYKNAAEIFAAYLGTIEEFLKEAKTGKIKGIGTQLSLIFEQIFKNQKIAEFEELYQQVPLTLLDILNLPGVGAKKVKLIFEELKITNLQALKKACEENKLVTLKGFSEKTQKQISQAIDKYLINSKQLIYPRALELAEQLKESLSLHVDIFEIVGELRRAMPTISKVEIVVVAKSREKIEEVLSLSPHCKNVSLNNNEIKGNFEKGLPFVVYLVEDKEVINTVFRYTGSLKHVEKFNLSKEFSSEEEIYQTHQCAYILPECREGLGEIEIAKEYFKSKKSFELLDVGQLKGIIHAHSTYSDGKDSLEEMASFVKAMGFEYLVISDHSRSAVYAGGLGVEKIKAQHQEIDQLNKKLSPFKIFKGIESDILADGQLDYPDEILASFDFVIVSIHSRFSQTKEEMTERMIKAVENPYTTLLAHPTGRLLLERDAYEVDLEKVILAAAKNNVVIEINSNPKRLDIDWTLLDFAKKSGIKFSISPDAHTTNGVLNIHYGVLMAKKGRLERSDFINCLSLKDFEEYLANVRKTKQKSAKH